MTKEEYKQAWHDYRASGEGYRGALYKHFREAHGHWYKWNYTKSQFVYIGVNPAYRALVDYIRDTCKLKDRWPFEGKFTAYLRTKREKEVA